LVKVVKEAVAIQLVPTELIQRLAVIRLAMGAKAVQLQTITHKAALRLARRVIPQPVLQFSEKQSYLVDMEQ
tara:strand:- start:189 stop:404 length:216 start_codon:yes stop_codon:yes gene_type:complete